VNAKHIIVVMLMVGAAAALLLRGERQPVQTVEPPPRQLPAATSQDNTLWPRDRLRADEPHFDYAPTPPSWGQGPYGPPAARSAPEGTGFADSDRTDIGPGTDSSAFRFRPLSERDRQRMGIPEPVPYESRPSPPAAPAEPYGSWAQRQFRFRPSAPREGAEGRYEAPYQMPPWGADPDYVERWDLPPDRYPAPPSQPFPGSPAQRMLPSLDRPSDRTVTAR
jgi:hypothetical protein